MTLFTRTFFKDPMEKLNGSVGSGTRFQNMEEDVFKVKSKLFDRGFSDEEPRRDRPLPTASMDSGIRAFQKENGLKIDGFIRPRGETERALFADKSAQAADKQDLIKPIFLSNDVGNNRTNKEDDVASVQKALDGLGLGGVKRADQASGIIDANTTNGIRRFQAQNDLKRDGIITPQGETVRAMNDALTSFAGSLGLMSGDDGSTGDGSDNTPPPPPPQKPEPPAKDDPNDDGDDDGNDDDNPNCAAQEDALTQTEAVRDAAQAQVDAAKTELAGEQAKLDALKSRLAELKDKKDCSQIDIDIQNKELSIASQKEEDQKLLQKFQSLAQESEKATDAAILIGAAAGIKVTFSIVKLLPQGRIVKAIYNASKHGNLGKAAREGLDIMGEVQDIASEVKAVQEAVLESQEVAGMASEAHASWQVSQKRIEKLIKELEALRVKREQCLSHGE